MKRPITLLLLLTATACALQVDAQTECNGTRYRTYDLFSDVDVTNGVIFGSNTAVGGGGNQTLRLDVYEPSGDTETDRPVVIIAFGGSFVQGSRADVASLCRVFAKLGYVAIAPDYRVGVFFPINQISTTLAVFRGAHDMKAAIRFLKKSVAEEGNPYGIDPERIIVGGVSAGAISAIHAAYLDKLEEVPAYMTNDTAGLGGIEGNSGNLGYSSRPFAVLNFSGTIGDSAWIEVDDLPICSIHEELDPTVPYGTEQVSALGFPTGLIASGSRDIHVRADNVGIDNCLLSYLGVENHVGYFSGGFDPLALDFARDFCADIVCGAPSQCGSVTVGLEDAHETTQTELSLYPNPTSAGLFFDADDEARVRVFDMTGRTIISRTVTSGVQYLDVQHLPQGTYVLQVLGETVSTTWFVKQ